MLAIEKGDTADRPFMSKILILMKPWRYRRGCSVDDP